MTKNELIKELEKIEGNPLVFFREPYDESETFALTDVVHQTVAEEFNGKEGAPQIMREYLEQSDLTDDSEIIILTV